MASHTIAKLKIVPATPEQWPALEDLFHDGGPCSRCWCMYWRLGSAYRRQTSEENKAAFRSVIEQGPPPGLIAFEGERAVGWCQVTPRSALPFLDKSRRLRAPDEMPVWSISCFYIRKGYRKRGITRWLIEAAKREARKAGAQILEAYPLDAELTPSASFTGYASTFARSGFVEVARHTPPRPIMRYELRPIRGKR